MSQPDFYLWRADIPQEHAAWLRLWESWPEREVFAHPDYAALYTTPAERACCAACSFPTGNVLYPFLWRDLTAEVYWREGMAGRVDIVTPYGYGGPFVWDVADRQALDIAFWKAFGEWAAAEGIVSEFVRFSLFDENLLDYPGEIEVKLHNVVRNLKLAPKDLWMDVRQKVRKNVNHARKESVQIVRETDTAHLDDFLRIYESTMGRRHAAEFYRFPRSFFERLSESLAGQYMYFHALYAGQIVSTELVLVSQRNVYSFLGGTDEAAFSLRPNDLLKFEIMLWAQSMEKSNFVLGGGYQDGDGIYRYKASFAPGGGRCFRIGRRILMPETYTSLVECRRALEGEMWQPKPGYFPAYRAQEGVS